MKTAFVLCLIFSITADSQQYALANKISEYTLVYSADTMHHETDSSLQTAGNGIGYNSAQLCKGNGIVTFINSSSQQLWFYYWYADDVGDASKECRIRRFWKQLDAGDNLFTIPKNKTLVFRICTSTDCLNGAIKQYGIVNFCNAINGIVFVK